MKYHYLSILLLFFTLSSMGYVQADPSRLSGGGNFTNGATDATVQQQFNALAEAGAGAVRLNLYPGEYFANSKPLPSHLDAQVLLAHQHGVQTIILLFEYYGSYQKPDGPPHQLGGYAKWHDIGAAFAERFAPNSAWLKSKGINNWGITIFQAFNEPDAEKSIPLTGEESYYNALRGLADGVHSVDRQLAVIPGGFMSENAASDHNLRGYGTAIAPLLNDGTLSGLDLHTYNDIFYAPILNREGRVTFDFSPQSDFDSVKAACHITRDIAFYSTEYNFKANEQGIDEALAARRLLTCIWANLGVVGADNKTSATKLALIWNLFNTTQADRTYGLNWRLDPWVPTARGRTFRLVMAISKGMEFTRLDPKGRGDFVLEGNRRKLWVWQNYDQWSNMHGTSYTVEDIPLGARKLEVFGWDGLRRSIDLAGQQRLLVEGLPQNETLMFLAGSGASGIVYWTESVSKRSLSVET
ncbi:MAG: hypothetical protein JO316_26935 [Abitibacteriaceae bacterium]|nr:hypothetical protein [Abditibacteriaceae bacterium]MBV9868998.1 hypothetical protein [Abditibacteriaceae bacterium]